MVICQVENCERPSKGKGLCPAHYERWRRGSPLDPPIRSVVPLERFLSSTLREDPSGCWIWVGFVHPSGYGHFKDNGQWMAHRWSYVHFVGPIPEGLELDHLCRVRHCVNPAHLEPVTRKENVNRGALVSTTLARIASRVVCKRGHAWPDNATTRANGSRYCRLCENERQRKRRAAHTPDPA